MIACSQCGTQNSEDAAFCMECRKPLKRADTLGGLETPPIEDDRAGFGQSGAVADLAPGSTFAGRYTIGEKIGEGGMGAVYHASEQLGARTRDIALKLIRADRLADEKAVERLVNEGVLMQDIRHPNVVAVYNVGVAEGRPFVAMEFVDGIALREWERRQQNARREIPLATVAQIIRGLLDGLDAAHRIGVIHRDLKPENIILTGEPGPGEAPLKILDFGIARAPGGVELGAATGLGTPNYMAPEQITNPAAAGPAADLYSLSVIFYELLMDVVPKTWQPPSGGRGDVPEAIDHLLEKALTNRPLSRPQSVAEYRLLLERSLGEAPTPTREPPAPPPPPGDRATIQQGAMFVLPKRDGQGNFYMPDMVDKDGQRTKWSPLTGYMGGYPKWVQVAIWVGVMVIIMLMIGNS